MDTALSVLNRRVQSPRGKFTKGKLVTSGITRGTRLKMQHTAAHEQAP